MNLCIYGKAPIEELEKIAIDYFENIENKDVVPEDASEPHPFTPEQLGKIYKVVPNNEIRQLDIKWIVPSTKHLYKSKPGSCLSHVLGHEGEGSLLSYLIAEGLATELSTYNDHILDSCDYMQTSIYLTEKGEKEYERVIKIVFACVNYLKNNDMYQYLFDEQVAMNKINFDNQTKSTAIRSSLNIVNRMQKLVERNVDMDNILYYPYLLEEYDEEAIRAYLSAMTPENTMIFFSTKSHEDIADQTEHHYHTKYQCSDFDQAFIEELSSISFDKLESDGTKTHNKTFHLPAKNEFIPYNSESMKSPELNEFRQLDMSEIKNCKAWYKQDDKFDQPRCNIRVILRTDDLDHKSSAKGKVFKKLWADMAEEKLREPGYMALLAQIKYSISSNAEGISLSFSGYNDGIQNFVEFLVKEIFNQEETKEDQQELFNNRKDLLRQDYKSVLMTNAYRRFNEFLHFVVNPRATSTDLLLEELEKFTYDDYLELKTGWLKNIVTEWQVAGHISEEFAKEMIDKCESHLASFKTDLESDKQYVVLEPQTVNEYVVNHINDNELNSTAI